MKTNDMLSINHLLCLLTYCNNDKLRRAFIKIVEK